MKKLIALLLAVLMIAGLLAACGGGGETDTGKTDETKADGGNTGDVDPFHGEDNIKLLVWAADNAQDLTKSLCDEFIAQYPDKKISIEVKKQGENDVGSKVANDPDKAADVFSLACDQLNDLVDRKLVNPVYNIYLDDVKERNTEWSVTTATLNDKLQAYPETGENAYYLVYDKRVVSDEEAQTLEGILAACKKAGKKFVLDCGNGFFSVMFPFTGGLRLAGLQEDGTQILNEYNKDEVVDSLEAFASLFKEYKDTLMSSDCNRIASGLAEDPTTVGAGVDGSWNLANVEKYLGENFGAAKLPTINVKGEDKQIVPFNGSKLIGVNSHSKFPATAQMLANFLTNEESQIKRLEAIAWAPSNKKAQETDTFKNNKGLSALVEETAFAVPQINVAANLWSPVGALGNKVKDGASREELDAEFDKAINSILYE